MSKFLPRIRKNSIRFKLMMGAVCVLFALIAFLLYNNYYAIQVIHDQVAESSQNLLAQYMHQIDSSLSAVNAYLSGVAALSAEINALNWSFNDNDRLLAKANLTKKLRDDIIAYNQMDCIFIYNPEYDCFLYAMNGAESYAEREGMKDYITGLAKSSPMEDMLPFLQDWRAEEINGQYYLMRLYRADQSYVGAWVRAKELLFPLDFIDMGDGGTALLITSDGRYMTDSDSITDKAVDIGGDFTNYYLTGTNKQYLLVGANSDKGDFSLVALIQDKKILENLPVLRYIITVIAFCSIMLVPLCLVLLNKAVIRPINRLLSVMKEVGDGDIEVRVERQPESDEFIMLNDAFNSMLDQIHALKIDVYEEQLNAQKAELKHLQMQVNPHFFLNSLNMIYRMSQMGKYDLIQDMALCLLSYFRYIFQNNPTFVPLRDEIKHVQNYIRIQELRFPKNLFCHVDAEEFMLDKPIPPLAIQGLVENAVKYAVNMDEVIHIHVEVLAEAQNGGEYMKVAVWDTGKGFSEPVLEQLRAGEQITDRDGEHTGIHNLQKRLQILYAGDAQIAFNNREQGGAEVTVTLPIQMPKLSGSKSGRW